MKITEDELLQVSQIFKALGDPTRIKILYELSKDPLCVRHIASQLDMTQSAISHQLKLLRDLRLVKFKKQGKNVIYSLDDDHVLNLFQEAMAHVQHD